MMEMSHDVGSQFPEGRHSGYKEGLEGKNQVSVLEGLAKCQCEENEGRVTRHGIKEVSRGQERPY